MQGRCKTAGRAYSKTDWAAVTMEGKIEEGTWFCWDLPWLLCCSVLYDLNEGKKKMLNELKLDTDVEGQRKRLGGQMCN